MEDAPWVAGKSHTSLTQVSHKSHSANFPHSQQTNAPPICLSAHSSRPFLQSMFALEVEIRPRSFDPVERELESEAVSEAPAADGLAPHPLAHRLLGGLAGAALGLVSGALLKALGGRIRRRIRRRVHASRPAVRQMVGGV